ncbi:MAG: PQQ-binding-like beta-propeller repeat protein [Verrucomicrobiota bacterium]|nr:PQQ-binding-like beta-propeller repeat protein [Verrucomicrobiota bacterium]
MMISVALVLAMGCGKKEAAPKPQEQSKAPSKPIVQDSQTGQPKAEAKKPGTVLWEFETGDFVLSSPAIGSDGTVYVGSSDKKLYAIKTDSKGLAKSPWPMRGQNPQHTGRAPAKK